MDGQVFEEKISFENPLFTVRIMKPQRHTGVWHYHKEIEILAACEGGMEVFLENAKYTLDKGDVVIIGSAEGHVARSLTPASSFIVLHFSLEHFFDESNMHYFKFFSETHRPLSQLNYVFREDSETKRRVFHLMEEIYREAVDQAICHEMIISSHILTLLSLLLRKDVRNVINVDVMQFQRLKPVFEYVDEHLHEHIKLQDVCTLLNQNYYYFVKYFKRATGLTFVDYVNHKKMVLAQRLLLTTQMSISEVSHEVGVANLKHFYTLFKHYTHYSPKQFQNRMLDQRETAEHRHPNMGGAPAIKPWETEVSTPHR